MHAGMTTGGDPPRESDLTTTGAHEMMCVLVPDATRQIPTGAACPNRLSGTIALAVAANSKDVVKAADLALAMVDHAMMTTAPVRHMTTAAAAGTLVDR